MSNSPDRCVASTIGRMVVSRQLGRKAFNGERSAFEAKVAGLQRVRDAVDVARAGTDAGSNALFGNLQKVTAMQLGLSPILMGAANSTGGVMGKMIDAQSIVVASTATGQQGREAAIFKAVFIHSIVLASLVGLIVLAYAYLFPGFIR